MIFWGRYISIAGSIMSGVLYLGGIMTVNPWVLHNKSLFLLKLNSPFTAIEQLFSSDISDDALKFVVLVLL